MAKRNRLTTNSDETDIATLISGDNVFSIPYFQRAYKWKADRIKQLNNDILNIVDGTVDFHFLGAIIIHGRRTNPSDPDVFDVIDGQQRVTTLYLYISAVVKTLLKHKAYSEAAGIFQKYLFISRKTSLPSNLKLHSCKEDRNQLNFIIKDIQTDKNLMNEMQGAKIKFMTPSGKDRGNLRNNYKLILRFLDEQIEQGGLGRLKEIYQAILNAVTLVQIDVWDPTNGPKIFDSLNSKQEPMTIGDLVRNEIFMRVADHAPADIDEIDENHWQPFYKKFQQNGINLFENYFFPYGLIQDPNLKKSDVYNSLKEKWNKIEEPEKIISELEYYQNAFIDIITGSNLQELNKHCAKKIRDLYLANTPSSTYPFLMQLSKTLNEEKINEKEFIKILDILESFLVRRAVCGLEPTGLHAVFKRLWKDCGTNPTPDLVKSVIKKHKTVPWPNNREFGNMLKVRPLYGSVITKYLLFAYNRDLGGDCPEEIAWIEHILPDKPDKVWYKDFKEEEHETLKDTLANLLPLSEEMNRSLSNKGYSLKKEKYKDDSMFKSARQLANNYSEWTPNTIRKRAAELEVWALKRWPHN